MILFPNAKINLGLRVLRRRPDGYHDVATLMVPVDWCDILEIVPSASGRTELTVTGRAVDCPPEKNLVLKAFRALSEVVPVPTADIRLHKVIPDGAGMGGGSADAAFTLLGLNEVFALGLSRRELAEVAARLGADCPFFVWNRPAICTGTGTDITPAEVDLSPYTLLIAKRRGTSVATAEAYAGISPHPAQVDFAAAMALAPEHWEAAGIVNDFEASVFPGHPAIAELRRAIATRGARYTAMTGSGAAVFGVFDSAEMAGKAAEGIADADIRICQART